MNDPHQTNRQHTQGLRTVAFAGNDFEAQMLVAILRDAEIDSFAFGHARTGIGLDLHPRRGGVPVQVPADDLQRAREILLENQTQSQNINWENIDVGERLDDLPLQKVGRMPPAAMLAFTAALLLIAGCIIALLRIFDIV